MDSLLAIILGLLILAFVAAACMAVYIFIHVFRKQRKFQKDFDRRWNNR